MQELFKRKYLRSEKNIFVRQNRLRERMYEEKNFIEVRKLNDLINLETRPLKPMFTQKLLSYKTLQLYGNHLKKSQVTGTLEVITGSMFVT